MSPLAARIGRMRSSQVQGIGVGLILLLISGCTPPGKPKLQEESHQPADFKTLYAVNCAGCHGADGKNGPGRILNDPLYLAVAPRETVKHVLIYGRPGTSMPAWAISEGGPLSPEQIETLLNGMEQNWSKPAVVAHLTLPPYSVSSTSGNADAGRKLFLRSCFMCHGPGAKVGSVTEPAYLSLVSNQMIRTSIIVGRPDLGMPDYRFLKAGKPLSDEDITDLVAFLESKRPADSGAGLSSQAQSGAPNNDNDGSNGPGSAGKAQGVDNKSRDRNHQGTK